MKKKLVRNFQVTSCILMILGFWIVSAQAAYFTLDSNSFYFGQRGAGVSIQEIHGTTDFGHPSPTTPSDKAVDMHGLGSASQTVTEGSRTYEVGETLRHDIEVEFTENDMVSTIDLNASLTVDGLLPNPMALTITDNNWGHHSYADAWGETVLAINGDPGKSVKVHIFSSAQSATNGNFYTNVGLGGCYPNNFSIWHNGVNIWDAGNAIDNPNGTILDDFVIEAMVGDTITINAAIWAQLSGTVWDTDFSGNYAWTNFHALATLEESESPSVPLPASFWFLGSGLVGLLGIRKRK